MSSLNYSRTSAAQWFAGVMLLGGAVSGLAAVHYVDLNSANAAPPYTNWTTAAAVIQDAVEVAAPGDEIVVTNGAYSIGGRPVGTNLLANRVAVDKPLTLRSVNGPQFTVLQGRQVPGTTLAPGNEHMPQAPPSPRVPAGYSAGAGQR